MRPIEAGDVVLVRVQTYTFKATGEGINDLVFIYKVCGKGADKDTRTP